MNEIVLQLTRSAVFARRPVVLAVFCLVTTLAAAAPAQALTYNVTILQPSNGRFNSGADINDQGVVAGMSGADRSNNGAALWQGQHHVRLEVTPPMPSYADSGANAINNTGMVAGWALSQAIVWNDGRASVLPAEPRGRAAAFGLNDHGQVVGWATQVDAGGNATGSYAALWEQGRHTGLATLGGPSSQALDINEHGLIAGWSRLADGMTSHAVVWQNGEIIDLGTAGGRDSRANAVNDHGAAAGSSYLDEEGNLSAVVWQHGITTVLDGYGLASIARDINNSGQVVGLVMGTSTGYNHATLWSGGASIDLNSFLAAADVEAGWHLLEANAINDAGWITGTAYNRLSNDYAAYRLSVPAIPEPGSMALALAGLATLGWAARRNRRVSSRG